MSMGRAKVVIDAVFREILGSQDSKLNESVPPFSPERFDR